MGYIVISELRGRDNIHSWEEVGHALYINEGLNSFCDFNGKTATPTFCTKTKRLVQLHDGLINTWLWVVSERGFIKHMDTGR